MPSAKELFDAGRLTDAIDELNRAVKARPADLSLRSFLFELLCFQGALDRASKQLEVIANSVEGGTELTVRIYQSLLHAEEARRRVFAGEAAPKFPITPSPFVSSYVVLVSRAARDRAAIPSLLDDAEGALPAIAGERDGVAFKSFRDADDRVAGVLEVFHGSEYLWVPLDQIVRLEIVKPTRLRELMWVQARLELLDQPAGDVFLPNLYVNSHEHADEHVRLGRTTDWQPVEEAMLVGCGARVFLVDDEPVPMLDLRRADFSPRRAEVPAR